jgi:hypothetical protein
MLLGTDLLTYSTGGTIMPNKNCRGEKSIPRWMTECDVIRYNLKMPESLKKKIKKAAAENGMDMSSYICGILSGDVKKPKL